MSPPGTHKGMESDLSLEGYHYTTCPQSRLFGDRRCVLGDMVRNRKEETKNNRQRVSKDVVRKRRTKMGDSDKDRKRTIEPPLRVKIRLVCTFRRRQEGNVLSLTDLGAGEKRRCLLLLRHRISPTFTNINGSLPLSVRK